MTKKDSTVLACQAWDIHNVLKTLYVALPDDKPDSEIPTRCLISHVLDMADALATDLGELKQ